MRIAQVVPSLEERHGGPSISVRALTNHLVHSGISAELLTTEEVPGSLVRTTNDHARIKAFLRESPRWLARSPGLYEHLLGTSFDCIHYHSLWLFPLRYATEAARRQVKPLIISPRGMMSGWAYQHHRWRKRVAEWAVHPGAFSLAAGWHATSAEEADDIRKLGFSQPICVSPNGVAVPSESELTTARAIWHHRCPASRSRPVALFYSRLHRKKRVLEMIDLWLSKPRGDWLLLVVGVAEEYTVAELNAIVTARGAQEKISVFDGNKNPAPYVVASLFVLPSHSENFGLVIAEALASGVPVLVTDTTPWQKLHQENAGWCVSWEKFPSTLNDALALDSAQLHAKGRLGRSWMERDFSWANAAGLLKEFYFYVSGKRA